ncbi:MAG: ABC transporter substrate-binding protein [Gammaproteobacteria bacterium]|nr:MAG: ABC transporter substrate-binding protein [Gammaproteobacteria bacterium]
MNNRNASLLKPVCRRAMLGLIASAFFLSFAHAQTVKTPADLPVNLVWQTNDSAPTFASDKALKGGIFRTMINDFPPTFRAVGPNANTSFVGNLRANMMSLTDIHPQTGEPLPALATHWALADDNKTVYFKLDPRARWSDGEKVTADDYLFMMKFMRSPHIVAPWYNNYYSEQIVDVSKYDDYTISVTLGSAKPRDDMLLETAIAPVPEHFHQLDSNWVQWANWKVEPTTGPYVIGNFRKGRYIDFVKVKDWWAQDLRYYKHRFNVDKVRVKVVRNINVGWNLFLKGELDSFGVVLPEFWHERTKTREFDNGWIRKIWFYNEKPQPTYGLYINLAEPLFADKRVRQAIAYALNVDKMNKTLLRGDYSRLPGFSTGYGDYSNRNIHPKPFDLDKAGALLDEAGWTLGSDGIREKAGNKLSFKVNYSLGIHTPRLALLKEEMKKAGIDMRLQLLTGASSYRNLMEKKHQVAWMAWGTGLRPQYREHFHSANANKPQTNNITNTADPEMDKLIEAYRQATTKPERVRLAHAIQEKIADIGAFIPTYMVPYTREAAWAYVRLPDDIAPKRAESLFSPMGLGTLWIDPAIKAEIQAKKKRDNTPIIDTRYRLGGD